MKLYYTPGACSMASHIVLNELHVPYETEKVDLKTHKTEGGQDFYRINPKGYVPSLLLDNGQVLTEGVAILSYLSDLKPELQGASYNDPIGRYRDLEWLTFISSEIHKSFSPLFNPTSTPEMINFSKEKIAKRFDMLDELLSGRPYLTGGSFNKAVDAYLFTMLTWCQPHGIDISRWKNLSAYMERLKQMPSVQKTLQEEGLAQ